MTQIVSATKGMPQNLKQDNFSKDKLERPKRVAVVNGEQERFL